MSKFTTIVQHVDGYLACLSWVDNTQFQVLYCKATKKMILTIEHEGDKAKYTLDYSVWTAYSQPWTTLITNFTNNGNFDREFIKFGQKVNNHITRRVISSTRKHAVGA